MRIVAQDTEPFSDLEGTRATVIYITEAQKVVQKDSKMTKQRKLSNLTRKNKDDSYYMVSL